MRCFIESMTVIAALVFLSEMGGASNFISDNRKQFIREQCHDELNTREFGKEFLEAFNELDKKKTKAIDSLPAFFVPQFDLLEVRKAAEHLKIKFMQLLKSLPMLTREFQQSEIKLQLYGSVSTGLFDETSDVDCSLNISNPNTNFLDNLTKQLQERYNSILSFDLITAKVPVLHIKDLEGRLLIDLSLNNYNAVRNSIWLAANVDEDPYYAYLCRQVRAWVRSCPDQQLLGTKKKPDGSYQNGLSSYAWNLLVLYYKRMVVVHYKPTQAPSKDSIVDVHANSKEACIGTVHMFRNWLLLFPWREEVVFFAQEISNSNVYLPYISKNDNPWTVGIQDLKNIREKIITPGFYKHYDVPALQDPFLEKVNLFSHFHRRVFGDNVRNRDVVKIWTESLQNCPVPKFLEIEPFLLSFLVNKVSRRNVASSGIGVLRAVESDRKTKTKVFKKGSKQLINKQDVSPLCMQHLSKTESSI